MNGYACAVCIIRDDIQILNLLWLLRLICRRVEGLANQLGIHRLDLHVANLEQHLTCISQNLNALFKHVHWLVSSTSEDICK